jgi:GNAT superfamily N-acetyltransferase
MTKPDIPAAGVLLAASYPHRAYEPEHWSERHLPNEVRRWVVDVPNPDAANPGAPGTVASVRASGEPVPASIAAYLSLWCVHARQYRLDLVVAPAWRRRGVGSTLLDFLVTEARGAGATSVQARPYADRLDAMHLLEARGFRETMRMTGLLLENVRIAAVESEAASRSALVRRGLRLTTFAAELARDRDSWRKLRDANQAAQFGWPDPDPNPDGRPHEAESVEEFRRRAEAFGMIPDACFIAATDDLFVGYSSLTVNDAARTQAGSGGTAVRPEYRGLGVATALKACCVRWAQEHGVMRLATSSGNPAMIRVNEKFGFRRTYEEIRSVLRLR